MTQPGSMLKYGIFAFSPLSNTATEITQLCFQVLTETDRSAKPSVILSAPDVERTDEQTSEVTRLALLHCLGDDILRRRRYALINYQTFSFIIGGYDFDIKNKIRSQPLNDFVYDIVRIRD